jgi:hypothetical protein
MEAFMAIRARRSLSLAATVAAIAVLSGCATTYNSAGDSYYSVWPFIGSRNPDLQLNYPAPDPNRLRLSRDPDPLNWISPSYPIDYRVWSPYSRNETYPPVRIAAQSDNAQCANRCNSPEPGALLALRADAGDGRRTALR